LLPIPRRYEAQGVRRYGFHGLSYVFLTGELARLAGSTQGRVILAHLGNGRQDAWVSCALPSLTTIREDGLAAASMLGRCFLVASETRLDWIVTKPLRLHRFASFGP
jgi:hypothetical protein